MGSDLPAIASENGWDATFSNGTDPRNQKIVSAVALALTLRQEALSNVQYNLYYVFCSSGSWESRQATSGGFGFGMVNDDGDQPWYPYYTNKLIGQSLSVGDRIVSSNSSSNDLRTLAWIHNGKLYTLVINTVDIPTTITLGSFANSAKFSLIDNTYAYTQPQVQTGIMNTSNELALKGYAVLLLESVTI
jgi:hypothetical protein